MGRYTRDAVVDRALDLLDRHGLADLTMRRLGTELGVQPSALYHHVPSKQVLLAAVADELLARGRRARAATTWDGRVVEVCTQLREALLAYRDGAEVVATAIAFGLGAGEPVEDLTEALSGAGLPDEVVGVAARTLLHFVLGHTTEEQTHLQGSSAGAIDAVPRQTSDFGLGLALVVDGIRVRTEPGDANGRRQEAPAGEVVRHQGLEPRTR